MTKLGEIVPRGMIEEDSTLEVRVNKDCDFREVNGRSGIYYLATLETREGVKEISFSRRAVDRIIEAGIDKQTDYVWISISRKGTGFDTDYEVSVLEA